jgi:RNA-directed DNA polymerase
MNHSNKDTRPSAENGEGRPLIKENAGQSSTYPTQSGKGVSQGLAGVRKAAREHKELKFTALLHHLNVDLLRESFYSLKRKAAPGVDGVTWQEYESGLENRLVDLHGRVHRGVYRALPSRRVYIQKEDGRQRPLGVAALEDKIVQQAVVVTILNQIYEEDFLGFSYGFRPGRSQHDALDALSYALLKKKVNYILDADIRGFFDNLDKSWMMQFMEHRVADPRILRLIRKWLKAGVMEEGQWSEPQTGTPQGSVVSPLLANVYLHYVFDLWVNAWRTKLAQGEMIVVRYADDTIVGFQHQTDADCFLDDLRERLAKFGLELHPDKTRRIEFGRFAEENRKRRGEGKPETFDFLGFTHISGKNSLGRFMVRRTTIRKRMRGKLRKIGQQLRERMHDPVPQTGKWLQSVVRGYFNYYAVPGNLTSLGTFRERVLALWWRSLRRRSQRRSISWTRILALGATWLPQPRALHPFPDARFAATHLR